MSGRGRPRKYTWFNRKALVDDYSSEAQYLRWASANNMALQTVAATGCPRCKRHAYELRHDRVHKIIRFKCTECSHETSYRIKVPKPGSYEVVPVFHNGMQVGEKILDHYHPATKRQRSDAVVLKVSRGVNSGRISLGGEWFIGGSAGGLHDQKRHFTSFEEAFLICNCNKMLVEHEVRLRKLEEDAA
jgi:hypothetical protein